MASRSEKSSAEKGHPGIFSPHDISINAPGSSESIRPPRIRHVSTPAYESPLRHHHRKHSSAREVKETLHARSEYTNSGDDGGGAIHRINQYQIKQEIGRGSFGAVHLAVDQHGQEYAVKEFSKSRLRKRAQSNTLRRAYGARRPGHLAAGLGFNSPLHQHSASDVQDGEGGGNSLYLIKEEIAIMKKLNHPNLVSLFEVLDDPTEDSLYMVLEMCKKGVVMKISMDEGADPYDSESCRCWFRDLILGIEYLHAQGVVHRDIKPDNLLLTEDDVLKIVDFGVSEIFEKSSEMLTAKSAGTPAFLPPELCVAKHGDISGKAADIWSMGVTLYCLRFGQIPFGHSGVLQLYESIKNDEVEIPPDCEEDFKDLISKLLEKDPSKRIKMPELREHPWVTKRGTDPLLSAAENTANLIEPPTEEETNDAITGKFSNMLVIMRAVKRFKNAIASKRPHRMDGILGNDTRMVQPPLSISEPSKPLLQHKTKSVDTHDRKAIEGALVIEGVHRDIDTRSFDTSLTGRDDSPRTAIGSPSTPTKNKPKPKDPHQTPNSATSSAEKSRREINAHPQDHRSDNPPSTPTTQPRNIENPQNDHLGKRHTHAHSPLSDQPFLEIGPGGGSDQPPDPPAVSESPPAAGLNIYEAAYKEEIQRIRENRGKEATLYLTRRVDKKQYQDDEYIVAGHRDRSATPKSGFARLLDKARRKGREESRGRDGNEGKDGDGDEGKDGNGNGNGNGDEGKDRDRDEVAEKQQE